MNKRQPVRSKPSNFQQPPKVESGNSLRNLFKNARARGFLNLADQALTQAPEEIFVLADHLEPDEKFWEIVELTRLDLSYNLLTMLQPAIQNLISLQVLTLRGNQLQELPDELFCCTALTMLDLSSNQLKEVKDGLGQLVFLKELQLASNRLVALPFSIGMLSRLESLKVESNRLVNLPNAMGGLSSLQTLTARENEIREIGEWIGSLPQLRLLELAKNSIVRVDPSISALRSLVYLDLRENLLNHIPPLPVQGKLTQLYLGFNQLAEVDGESLLSVSNVLCELHLQNNQIRQLPETIGSLVKLKVLDISNNNLSDLLPALGYLPELHRVVLDGNPLRAVRRALTAGSVHELKKYLRTRGPPPAFKGLIEAEPDEVFEAAVNCSGASDDIQRLLREAQGTHILSLKNQNLVEIPPSIYGVDDISQSLYTLELTGNKIEEIPDQLCSRLKNLVVLDVSSNVLQEVPSSLGCLRLKRLLLRGNQLTFRGLSSLCPAFQTDLPAIMHSVEEIDVRNNQLQELPSFLFACRSLQILLVGFNKLRSLASINWTRIQQLRTLDLSNNRLTDIGKGLELLPNLDSLDIQNNELAVIPPELGLCPGLRSLLLIGNPQRGVRQNLIDKGTPAILEHLNCRLPEGYRSEPVVPPSKDGASFGTEENYGHEYAKQSFQENVPRPTSLGAKRDSYSDYPQRSQNQFAVQEKWQPQDAQYYQNPPTYQEEYYVQQPNASQYPYVQQQSYTADMNYARQQNQPFKTEGSSARSRPSSNPHQQSYTADMNYAYQQNQPFKTEGSSARSRPSSNPHQQRNDDVMTEIDGLNTEIYLLEQQLEDFSISQAKKYSLKKQVALKRANKAKLERQLQL